MSRDAIIFNETMPLCHNLGAIQMSRNADGGGGGGVSDFPEKSVTKV